MAGVKVKPAAAYVIAAEPVVLVDPTTGAPYSATGVGGGTEYEVVEASQTDQMCGTTGAAGDALNGLLIIPLTTSPGEVSIEDGSTNTVVFAGGATSVSTLIPFFVDLQGIKTVNGGWEITTGADVRVIAFGNFT